MLGCLGKLRYVGGRGLHIFPFRGDLLQNVYTGGEIKLDDQSYISLCCVLRCFLLNIYSNLANIPAIFFYFIFFITALII